MNEERFKACQSLIQELLNSSSSEQAWQILNANQELVDPGLVEVMGQVSQELTEKGNWKTAKTLNLQAFELKAVLENPLSEGTSIEALILLHKLLKAGYQRNNQEVYALLEANLNKLDQKFATFLKHTLETVLLTVHTSETMPIVQGLWTLGNLIYEFSSGERGVNLEIALVCYEITALFFPPGTQGYGLLQYNLGNVYIQRIKGDRLKNLKLAIDCYKKALKVNTANEFPEQLVAVLTNLEDAYRHLRALLAEIIGLPSFTPIRDDQDTFLKQVLKATRDSRGNQQKIYDKKIYDILKANLSKIDDDLPGTLLILAVSAFCQVEPEEEKLFALDIIAFIGLIREFPWGNKAINLEMAIVGFIVAAIVFTREVFPQEWAVIQNDLGVTYNERIRGERAKNLEAGIHCLQLALEVRTRQALPQEWAQTQNNLGIAYRNRIRGNKHKNLEAAIHYFQAALEEREPLSQDWAETKVNLGNAYFDRVLKDRAENLEIAIRSFQDALKVYTSEKSPQKWAIIQLNLGNAYLDRIKENKAENLEAAIQHFQNASSVLTSADFPQEFIVTQLGLGNAYRERIEENKTENLEAASDYLLYALTVISAEAFPERYAEFQYTLGLAYKEKGQLKFAKTAFSIAIDIVESLREEIFSGIEEDKQNLAEKWNQLYRSMVEVHLKMYDYAQALEYVERSKTRNLLELLARRELYPQGDIPEPVRSELQMLQQEIKREKRRLEAEAITDYTHLNQLRQTYYQLSPDYQFISFDQIQNLIDDHTAIIQWYILFDYFCAFIITRHNSQPLIWKSSPKDLENLETWDFQYVTAYHAPREAKTEAEKQKMQKQWETTMPDRLEQLAKILHIDEILFLIDKIFSQIPEISCDQLILVPHLYLHLFPLHALAVGESYLLDRFSQGVGYAPSCQLLQQVQQRERPDFQSLFAIENPTEDLQFTDQEVNSILSLFPSHKVLSHSHATKAALDEATLHLQEVNYLHFSCHGSFNPDSPFLLLADAIVSSMPTDADPKQYLKTSKGFIDLSKCLTLGNLFERGFDLNKCRLVVLSACETGLIDFNNISDEYIGLPSGFLYAGSSSVVSSLWTVDDMSTAYLMIKFVQNLKAAVDEGKDVSVALALNQAQRWLRNITWEDLEKWANDLSLDSSKNREIREIVAKSNLDKKIDKKPFQSPYH